MINDLQQIYLTWVKDMQNNWLEVLPRPIQATMIEVEQQQQELELDERNVEQLLPIEQPVTTNGEELGFLSYMALLKTTANMLKVQMYSVKPNKKQNREELNGNYSTATKYSILAISPTKKSRRKFSEFWLAVLLEDNLTDKSEVRVQWMQGTTRATTEYELMELEDTIPTESIICSGIKMSFIWKFQQREQLGVWKLITSEGMITNLHEEVKLERNKLESLPLRRAIRRVLDLNVS
jgi:hypothetical protein